MKMSGIVKTVAFLAVVFAAAAVAEDYTVGDDQGWMVPSSPALYTTWASGKTFRVGDVLEFEFTTGNHDVAIVTKQAYDSCTKTNPTRLITTGPAEIPLNQTGPYYFICTVGQHCSAGQKLSITVTTGTTRGNTTTPMSPPSTTSDPPTATSPTPTGMMAPPPPNSAAFSSIGRDGAVTAFFVGLIASAIAFMC